MRADLRAELAGYEALVSSELVRGKALEDIAALAERAHGKLHFMNDEERAEVISILQLSVVTSAPVNAGKPQTKAISGVLDPSLWGEDSNTKQLNRSVNSDDVRIPLAPNPNKGVERSESVFASQSQLSVAPYRPGRADPEAAL